MNRAESIKRYIAKKQKLLSKSENVGIFGHVKVYITDNKTGNKRLVFDDHNAIQSSYATIIVDALQATTDYGMDNMFNGNANPPPDGEDGIAIKDGGGLWYEMIMAATVRSASTITFTGTFTGVGITIADANSVLLGHDWLTAAPNDFVTGGGAFAKPSSWASQAVLNTETITIEWILSHQAT